MGTRVHCCFGRLHVKDAAKVVALFTTIIVLASTFLLTFQLVTIKSDFPALIPSEEFNSPNQFCLSLIFEWIPYYRLAFFYLEQISQIFVCVFVILGTLNAIPSLLTPYIWFNLFYMVTNMVEIGECIFGMLTINNHPEIPKSMNKNVFRSLMQFVVCKLLLQLCFAYCLWIVCRAKVFFERH